MNPGKPEKGLHLDDKLHRTLYLKFITDDSKVSSNQARII